MYSTIAKYLFSLIFFQSFFIVKYLHLVYILIHENNRVQLIHESETRSYPYLYVASYQNTYLWQSNRVLYTKQLTNMMWITSILMIVELYEEHNF